MGGTVSGPVADHQLTASRTMHNVVETPREPGTYGCPAVLDKSKKFPGETRGLESTMSLTQAEKSVLCF